MKKFFIIFLTFVLVLCIFNIVIAEEKIINPIDGIREQLDKIEGNINRKNIDEAKLCLISLREYVYMWASELTKQNKYTSRVLDIINFSALAIEKNDIEYIVKARIILDEVFSDKIVILENNHS